MKNEFTVRKADREDIPLIQTMIKSLAAYERRQQDMTGTQESLYSCIFDKKLASVLIAEYSGEAIGYAIYYPIFCSFAAVGKVHLEDMFLYENFRHNGLGKIFFSKIEEFVRKDGFSGIEWSCLDWNTSAADFYDKIGAEREEGRIHYTYEILTMDK